MKIYIEESSWSGWTLDYKPKIENKVYEIEKDKKIVVKIVKTGHLNEEGKLVEEDKEDFSFKVVEINEYSIVIETNTPMSCEDKGVNLGSDETKFVIKKGNSVKLVTPTFDCGYIYTIEIK